jgi:hypothetical protein
MEFQLRTSFKGLCDRTKIKSFLAAKRLMAVGNGDGESISETARIIICIIY